MLLSHLAQTLAADLDGDGSIEISACATLDEAVPSELSFLTASKYASKLGTTRASALIVSQSFKRPPNFTLPLLKSKDPYYAFRNAIIALHGYRQHPDFSSPTQAVLPSSNPAPATNISPLAYVHPTATIGDRTTIYPFVFVGPHAKIGADCILYPHVSVHNHCILGDRVILHPGVSIGHDGYGFATHALPGQAPAHHKIPQAGITHLEDDVEIGANTCIERSTIGSTHIARGTKLGSGVVIGHGTKIGQHNLLVAQVGIAGSCTTGAYVVMGGQAGVAGHLHIADQVQLAAQSGVMTDVEEKGQYFGAPIMPAQQGRRVYSHLLNLDEIVKRVKELEKQVESLTANPS